MTSPKEDLWRSTDLAHATIQYATFDLQTIAQQIEYLHPKMADELDLIAGQIEHARKTIQGNACEMINLDLAESRRRVGEIFVALLNKSAS